MPWHSTPVLPLFHLSEGRPPPPRGFKVATVIFLLTGRALEWATAIWERGENELGSYERFMALFSAGFYHPPEDREGGE